MQPRKTPPADFYCYVEDLLCSFSFFIFVRWVMFIKARRYCYSGKYEKREKKKICRVCRKLGSVLRCGTWMANCHLAVIHICCTCINGVMERALQRTMAETKADLCSRLEMFRSFDFCSWRKKKEYVKFYSILFLSKNGSSLGVHTKKKFH